MASIPPEGVCDISIIPWNPTVHTAASPSVIVYTLAIGWYYLTGLFSQGGSTAVGGLWAFFFIMILAVAQTLVIINQPQCPPIKIWGLAMAWSLGILFGFIGYTITKYLSDTTNITPQVVTTPAPERFTNKVVDLFTIPPNQVGGDIKLSTDAAKGSSSDHCAAVGDDTFIVDLYKNGQLVTQTIGEKLAS